MMDKLEDTIETAIEVTEDGRPHIVNIPQLKKALMLIADMLQLQAIQIEGLKRGKDKD